MKLTYPQWINFEGPQRIPNKNWNFQYNGYSYRNNNIMRMTMSTGSTMTSRVHRKVIRIPSKRHPGKALPGKLHSINRPSTGKLPPGKRINPTRATPSHCDNSNDSGLGFDHHVETPFSSAIRNIAPTRLVSSSLVRSTPRPVLRRPPSLVTLQSQIGSVSSKDGKSQLQILAQPEQQHRARYQTEGSRGAVKDRSGNGFPIVKLSGYNKSAILEIFIGTDIGRVAPHMFYQACKVSGKNSTQCIEKKVDGTMVIEIELKSENDMTATCDCVGILKERNVDVEHRFPDQSGPRSKKKSTRCRMVFRTQLTNDDGSVETLQICSQQIICTQPPGVPEICKKSLTSCPAIGGLELFIIGKNFLKDTRVIFQARRSSSPNHNESYSEIVWEETVLPDKEFLQQTHLVCVVPPYANPDISDSIVVQLFVTSSNKKSESHNFMYTPKSSHGLLMSTTSAAAHAAHAAHAAATTVVGTMQNSLLTQNQDLRYNNDESSNSACSMMIWNPSIEPINEIDADMMPPPSTLPLSVRRPSSGTTLITADSLVTSPLLKAEIIDESSQGSIPDVMNHDSMDRMPGSNENSLDGSSPIKDLQMIQQRIRKHSIDIMDNNSIMVNDNSVNMMMHDTNSMTAFPTTHDNHIGLMAMDTSPELKVVDLRVKQEQIAAQLQQYVNNCAGNKTDSGIMPVGQNNTSVNSFLTNFKSTVNTLQNTPVDTVSVASLYGNSASNNSNDVIFTQQDINNINSTTTNQATIDQTFSHNLMTEAGTTSMNHILSFPSTQSIGGGVAGQNSIMDSSSVSSPSQLSSQDIILNSTATATLNSTTNVSLIPSTISPTTTSLGMSTDIILNPTVSPTMMCHNAADQTNLIAAPQVTSVLTCQHTMSSQNSPTNMLNNLMQPMQQMSPTDQQQQQPPQPPPMHMSRSSPVAVKNMILNAAADILSSRPSNLSAETTIDALMSLNASPMLNDQQQQQASSMMSPMLLSAAVVASSSVSPNGVILSPTVELNGTNLSERVCHNNSALDQRSIQNMFIAEQQQTMADAGATLMQQTSDLPSLTNIVTQQDLINHQDLRNGQLHHRIVSQDMINDYQKMNNVPTSDALLQAVALVRNDIPVTTKSNVATTMQQLQQNSIAVAAAAAACAAAAAAVAVPPPNTTASTNIPQDIAIMSDNDLIRYINPSCFDQV